MNHSQTSSLETKSHDSVIETFLQELFREPPTLFDGNQE